MRSADMSAKAFDTDRASSSTVEERPLQRRVKLQVKQGFSPSVTARPSRTLRDISQSACSIVASAAATDQNVLSFRLKPDPERSRRGRRNGGTCCVPQQQQNLCFLLVKPRSQPLSIAKFPQSPYLRQTKEI